MKIFKCFLSLQVNKHINMIHESQVYSIVCTIPDFDSMLELTWLYFLEMFVTKCIFTTNLTYRVIWLVVAESGTLAGTLLQDSGWLLVEYWSTTGATWSNTHRSLATDAGVTAGWSDISTSSAWSLLTVTSVSPTVSLLFSLRCSEQVQSSRSCWCRPGTNSTRHAAALDCLQR